MAGTIWGPRFYGKTAWALPDDLWGTLIAAQRLAHLNLAGLSINADVLQELLAVKPQAWRKELGDIRQYLAEFGSRTPGTLYNELEEVEERLGRELAEKLDVLFLGFLNFLVSFSLAFFVAIRSRKIRLREYTEFLGILGRYMRRFPLDFFRAPALPRQPRELND